MIKQFIKPMMTVIALWSGLCAAGGIGIPGVPQVVYDPWNEMQTTMTATSSAAQLANTTQLLANELINLKNYDGNQIQWSHAVTLLTQLARVLEQGQALSYSMQNVDTAFKQKYPGYQPERDYNHAYQTWSMTTMDTLQNTLQSAGLQGQEFESEQHTLEQLKIMSATASGRMQAVQLGNMIASEQVGQMQKLRQLVMSQTNSQNTYMAYQVQKDQAEEAATHDLFDNPPDFPRYGSGVGFGSESLPHLSH